MYIITIKVILSNNLLGLVVITVIKTLAHVGFFSSKFNFHNIIIKTKININNAFQLMLTGHRVKRHVRFVCCIRPEGATLPRGLT